jgi:type IV pilus assembly protein PilV
VLLLEALIAILLFSFGILAVVGLQAGAIKNVTQGKYRTDAAFLNAQIIGQMWGNRNNVASFNYGGGAPPAVLAAWVTQVQNTLPLAGSYPPTVTVIATNYPGPPTYTAYQVTVTTFWQTPEEYNSSPRPAPHNQTTTAFIQCC